MPLCFNRWFLPRKTHNGGTCVETKFTKNAVLVRNNLRPREGTAIFTHEEWEVFVDGVKDGDYDISSQP